MALEGIRNCQEAGIKVGLRFTVNKFNVQEIPKIFALLEEMDIPRVCFYHRFTPAADLSSWKKIFPTRNPGWLWT